MQYLGIGAKCKCNIGWAALASQNCTEPRVGSKKKVIVRMEDQTVLAGYLPAAGLLNGPDGRMELLDPGGRIVEIELSKVRYVAYVRDFNLQDSENPGAVAAQDSFLARPRTEGLWLRMKFKDGEVLEGLAALDVSLLDDARADAGVYVIPPDVRSNTQRIFVPRTALSGLQVVGVITTPSKAAEASTKSRNEEPLLPFPEVTGRLKG